MTVTGIHDVYLETHNWGKTVAFWQALGYRLELDLGKSGILRSDDPAQPYLFVEEVSPDRQPVIELYLKATQEFAPGAPAEVVGDGTWEDSHWGTRLLPVRDPDGRTHWLQVGEPSG